MHSRHVGRGMLALCGVITLGGSPPEAAAADTTTDQSDTLAEVIVTAEKRSERLQDVPIPVTAISAAELADANQLRLQDYYTQIPGLTVIASQGQQLLAIRGVTTGGGGNPTVGVTIDDVPYGSSTSLGGSYVPDIDPSELARVEVLRGPQGTLYGASSLGGLVKYVTVDPSMDGFSGRVETGMSSVHNGAELGYNVRGVVNIPINDTLAIRASAFTREDPGYIDNPVQHIDGINEDRVSGGRVAALWQPSPQLSLKLSALIQDFKGNGLNEVNLPANGYAGPTLSGLQQDYLPGVGDYDHKLQAYSATLKAKLGNAELTSITAFNVSHFFNSFDYTFALGECCTFPAYGVTGTPVDTNVETDKFTQEVRLSMPIGQHVDWLMGAFYTHERGPFLQQLLAENGMTGQVLATSASFIESNVYSEYSAFTDVTLRFTDRFQVQLGGREAFIDQTYEETDAGGLIHLLDGLPPPVVYPSLSLSESAFTYLVTPKFQLTPDIMAYARLASGYRPGGANPSSAPFGLPLTFQPDKTRNYEVGIKGDTLHDRLSFDASLYYIDWKNIQLSFVDPTNGFGFDSNGSRAKSQGVELAVNSKPAMGLTVGAWIALNQAQLTAGLPPNSAVYGVSGDRLPFSSRFSGNISLQQEVPLTAAATGFANVTTSYVGGREGLLTGTPGNPAPRQYYPAYAKTDLRVGVKYASWDTNLFVTNLMDKRGLLNGGPGYSPPFAFVYIQPRVVGLSLARRF